MSACRCSPEHARVMVPLLMRLSSPETLRAVNSTGRSAADWFLWSRRHDDTPWVRKALYGLLRAGVPVRPSNAPSALEHMASLGAELDAAVARGLPVTWQEHDAAVSLAIDMQEVAEIEAALAAREARAAELERELGGGGGEEAR